MTEDITLPQALGALKGHLAAAGTLLAVVGGGGFLQQQDAAQFDIVALTENHQAAIILMAEHAVAEREKVRELCAQLLSQCDARLDRAMGACR